MDHIFVKLSGAGGGNRLFPDAAGSLKPHLLFLPAVEIAVDRDLFGVGCVNPEGYAVRRGVRTEIVVGVKRAPDIEVMQIHFIIPYLIFIVKH